MPTIRKVSDIPLNREAEIYIKVKYTSSITREKTFRGSANFVIFSECGLQTYDINGVFILSEENVIAPDSGITSFSTINKAGICYEPSGGSTFTNYISKSGLTHLQESDIDNFLANPAYITNIGTVTSAASATYKHEITIVSNVPVFLNTPQASIGGIENNINVTAPTVWTFPTVFDPYKLNAGNTSYNCLGCIIAKTFNPPNYINHNVYIQSPNSKETAFTIQTEHNFDGEIISDIVFMPSKNLAVEEITNQSTRDSYFTHFSNVAKDKPQARFFSYNPTWSSSCMKFKFNTIVTKLIAPDIAFCFRDTLIDTNGQKHIYYSQIGAIVRDTSTGLLDNGSWRGYDKTTFDNIIFHNGDPSIEEQSEWGDGDAGSGTNFDGTDAYIDDNDSDTSTYGQGGAVNVYGDFIDCFRISGLAMKSLRQKIWSQDFFNILKINSNPMENIVSLKKFPFSIGADSTSEIVIGNIATGVSGYPISNAVHKITFPASESDGKIGGLYNNFIDMNSEIILYLPFIGFKSLDPKLWMYAYIKVEYLIDITSGACQATLLRKKLTDKDTSYKPMEVYNGQCGFDIPITASNEKSAEIAYYSKIASAGVQMASGAPLPIAVNTVLSESNKTYQHSAMGGAIGCAGWLSVILIRGFNRPLETNPYNKTYLKTYGAPLKEQRKLSDFEGFVQCGGYINLDALKCTEPEKEEIDRLLREGVIV